MTKNNDKFTITVINLIKLDNATDKENISGLQNWGSFFKAKSWEDIKMLATKDDKLENAAETVFLLSQDALIREQCERREGRIRAEEIKKQWYEQAVAEKEQALAAIAEKDRAIADKEREIAALKEQLKNLQG